MSITGESTVSAVVRQFIEETFLYMHADAHLGTDDLLLRKGVVDSMGVLELLAFLEMTFDIGICDDDVTEHNLGTLRAIERFVMAKRIASAA
jgi:acyl carrier protein